MVRRIPFLFCRYQFLIDGELLDTSGQFEALTELQGEYFAHGRKAEREGKYDSVIMRPRRFELNGHQVLSWSVGQTNNLRVAAEYDSRKDELELRRRNDKSVRFSDFVAVPDLNSLAVDDRVSPVHLGGKAAIRRFQSIFRNFEDGEAEIQQSTSRNDIDRALELWELKDFSFVVRPYNPHPVGDLSRRLSEQLAADGIGRYTGRARPASGRSMKPSQDGHIAAAIEMTDAGYGQFSIRGVTGDGHDATIKKQHYSEKVELNKKRLSEPRELRVHINVADAQEEKWPRVVAMAMVEFYGD